MKPFLVLLCLALVPCGLALQDYGNVTLQASGINASVTLDQYVITCAQVVVDPSFLFFDTCNYTESGLPYTVTLNYTTPNTSISLLSCGNGIIESPEACDNGASNGECPATCNSVCRIVDCSAVSAGSGGSVASYPGVPVVNHTPAPPVAAPPSLVSPSGGVPGVVWGYPRQAVVFWGLILVLLVVLGLVYWWNRS